MSRPQGDSYIERLRRMASAQADASHDDLSQLADAMLPDIRRHMDKSARAAPAAPVILRKRPRSPSPPPEREPSDDDDDDEEADDVSVSTSAASRALAPPQQPIGGDKSTMVPHRPPPPVDPVLKFMPLDEAFDETRHIVEFYEKRAHFLAIREEDRCFPCEYGNKTYDSSPDYGCQPYLYILKMINANYAHASVMNLAITVHEYFERVIIGPLTVYMARHNLPASKFPVPRMSVQAWVRHIRSHTLNPHIMIGEKLRHIDQIAEVVRNRIVSRATGEVDSRMVDSYQKLLKLQHTYMTTPKDRLLFNTGTGESLDLDPSKMGRLGNLRRVESLLINNNNTIGGQTATDSAASTGDVLRTNFVAPEQQAAIAAPAADDDGALLAATLQNLATVDAIDAMDIDG
jgi:hypothetical protein